MYKMTVYSQFGHDVRWERMLHCDTMKEGVVLALEKAKFILGSERVSLSRVKHGRHNIFMNHKYMGELRIAKV